MRQNCIQVLEEQKSTRTLFSFTSLIKLSGSLSTVLLIISRLDQSLALSGESQASCSCLHSMFSLVSPAILRACTTLRSTPNCCHTQNRWSSTKRISSARSNAHSSTSMHLRRLMIVMCTAVSSGMSWCSIRRWFSDALKRRRCSCLTSSESGTKKRLTTLFSTETTAFTTI